MKLKWIFPAVVFVILTMVGSLQAFPPVTNLSQTKTDSHSPRVAVDSFGRIVAVWVEEDWPVPGIADIFFSLNSGEEWTGGRETVSQLYDARSPRLVCGPAGLFHLVYDDGSDWSAEDIFTRTYSVNDGCWSNIERVFNSYFISKHPVVRVGAGGRLFVMWTRNLKQAPVSKVIMNSREPGGTWSEDVQFISQNQEYQSVHSSFALYQDHIHAAWLDNRSGLWEIHYNDTKNGTWGTPQRLTQGGGKSGPSLVTDRKGGVHILYASKAGNISLTHKTQNSWTVPVILSTGPSEFSPPGLALHKNNTLHAVWVETHSGNSAVYYARGTAQGNWLPPFKAADGKDAGNPQIILDDESRAHIVWEDSGLSGKKDIFYAEAVPSGVSPVPMMTLSDEAGIVPCTLEFDASGSAAGEGDLLSFWWYFGDGSPLEEGESVSHTFDVPGTFTVRLYATNTRLLCAVEKKEVSILDGPFPPVDVKAFKATDRALFYADPVNAVVWKENPRNTGIVSVLSYVVYRKLKTAGEEFYGEIGRTDGSTFEFTDRNFASQEERDLFDYAVSAVDSQGREGPKQAAENTAEYAAGPLTKSGKHP